MPEQKVSLAPVTTTHLPASSVARARSSLASRSLAAALMAFFRSGLAMVTVAVASVRVPSPSVMVTRRGRSRRRLGHRM
jgi:hypothetical protein